VVSVIAIANGSREQILSSIRSLGTNTIDIYPGSGPGDPGSSRVHTLREIDTVLLSSQSYVDSATPNVSASVTARHGDHAATAQVNGVGKDYFRVRGIGLLEGSIFGADAVEHLEQSAIIDQNMREKLFGRQESPVGKIIMLGKVPCRVIGVSQQASAGFGGGMSPNAWVPYTTVMRRLLGQGYVSSITARIADNAPIRTAERAIVRLLTLRHGRQDFFVQNTAQIRATIESTTQTITLLIASIASISLIVGGIGVMNIMLVSVTERTREIGVRMAVGARQTDILRQFLIEAVSVCLLGGGFGVLLAYGLGALVSLRAGGSLMIFSPISIIVAFAFSTLIGVAFGIVPARIAARLDPVHALARD
jgi:macrolide transport system ATP-binding/permease protein